MAGRNQRNTFGRNDGGRNDNYFCHDDRTDRMEEFKSNYKGRGYRGRRPFRGGVNSRDHQHQDQSGTFDSIRTNIRRILYERGRGRGKGKYHKNSNFKNQYQGWNEVVIRNVQGADGDEVIATLRRFVDNDFSPILPGFNDTTTFKFYLENSRDAAHAMLNLSGRITLDNGQKLKIIVCDSNPTYQKPTPEKYEIIKKVMSDRYSVELNRIDLKNFHNDPKLIQSKLYVPLYLYEALTLVVQIIKANIPQVQDIDLSHNKIYNPQPLEIFKELHVKRLNLEHNRIGRLHFIARIKSLSLIDLNLTGNSFATTFKNSDSYISNMRKLFPKLQYLDGVELPKIIGFEVSETLKMPSSLGSQFCSEEAKGFLKQFIQQYYQVFECGNRRLLEAAYTADACFSMLSVIPDHISHSRHVTTKFYNGRSRNLMRLQDPERRYDHLIQGKKNIVDVLCSMPQSLHDPSTFIVDVPIAQPQLLHVCLRGLLKFVTDGSPGSSEALRSFSRSMIIIPVGSGFCISNEEFFISLPSQEQKYKYSQKAIVETLPPTPSVNTTQELPSFLAGLADLQIEMVKQFSQHSKMRPQFSKECLERNEWNFDTAAQIFVTLKSENKIPSEYFDA